MAIDPRLLFLPTMRAAYSDRTSWMMAYMAQAAYKSGADLKQEIAPLGFEVVKEFSKKETQGYLARRDDAKIAVLGFRGTEKKFEDIKADLKANLVDIGDGAKVHRGFWDAHALVAEEVKQGLETLSGYVIYITGHSLGGALAVVYARQLNSDNIAACYTYGSPRVGNLKFVEMLKVPIYRVVNTADGVPRIPPPIWGIQLLIFLAMFLPASLSQRIIKYFKNLRGYVHYGDERYLTICKDPAYKDISLIYNSDIVTRISQRIQRFFRDRKAVVNDHEIARYCKKLETYALKRI